MKLIEKNTICSECGQPVYLQNNICRRCGGKAKEIIMIRDRYGTYHPLSGQLWAIGIFVVAIIVLSFLKWLINR